MESEDGRSYSQIDHNHLPADTPDMEPENARSSNVNNGGYTTAENARSSNVNNGGYTTAGHDTFTGAGTTQSIQIDHNHLTADMEPENARSSNVNNGGYTTAGYDTFTGAGTTQSIQIDHNHLTAEMETEDGIWNEACTTDGYNAFTGAGTSESIQIDHNHPHADTPAMGDDDLSDLFEEYQCRFCGCYCLVCVSDDLRNLQLKVQRLTAENGDLRALNISLEERVAYLDTNRLCGVDPLHGNGEIAGNFDVSVSGPHQENGEIAFVGLINQGATCFLSSFLQSMYHIPLFRKAVFGSQGYGDAGTISALQNLFCKLQVGCTSVSTEELTKSFGWNHSYVSKTHQDLQEFSILLFEKLEMLQGTGLPDILKSLFEGRYQSLLTFPAVNAASKTEQPFYDIQLDVMGFSSVYQSLEQLARPVPLAEKYKTLEYGAQDTLKSGKFMRMPPVLRFHLRRFDWTENSLSKINDEYTYPLQLDMCRGDGKYLVDELRGDDYLYTLHSVLVHRGGGGDLGHYYAYIRPTSSDKWFMFDDQIVREADSATALGQIGGDETNGSAYYLVYIRKSLQADIMCAVDVPEVLMARNGLTNVQRSTVDVPQRPIVANSRNVKKKARGREQGLDASSKPFCSCTGKNIECRQNHGWQSKCCTKNISCYPLPMKPNSSKMMHGRTMCFKRFKKLLEKLNAEGFDTTVPIDLKPHWGFRPVTDREKGKRKCKSSREEVA